MLLLRSLCHSSGGGGGGKSKYVGGADACRAGKAAMGRVVAGRAVAGRMVVGRVVVGRVVVGRVVVGTLAVLEAITPDIGGRAWTASPLLGFEVRQESICKSVCLT